MTQYHYLDDSGDPGLVGKVGSSSHFVLAMVQLPQRAPLSELAALRQRFHLPPTFEFKYYRARQRQKAAFFESLQGVPFRARIAVVDKASVAGCLGSLSGQELTIELIVGLAMRALSLDVAEDFLIVDGATRAFLQGLRIRLSQESRHAGRVRPFKTIVGAKSNREDGLQLADMVAGAARQYLSGDDACSYQMIASKVVDSWKVSELGK